MLMSLTLFHNILNALFSAFKSVGFILTFAVVIENVIIHICLESEILRKQKFAIMEQIVSH